MSIIDCLIMNYTSTQKLDKVMGAFYSAKSCDAKFLSNGYH